MGWLSKNLGYGIRGYVDADNPGGSLEVATTEDGYTITKDYDSKGNLIYQGWAVPGGAKSDPVWKIKKYTYAKPAGTSVITDEQWAGGAATLSNVWNNRASLSYS